MIIYLLKLLNTSQFVSKSEVFQVARSEKRKYLLLTSFVVNNFYLLNDILVDIIIQSVQTALNTTLREQKELIFESRKSKNSTINLLTDNLKTCKDTINKIGELLDKENIKTKEKMGYIRLLITDNFTELS